jgi:GH25 family lysozyme M1 (1,4-beta-N-acetylmuramidase)
MRVLGADFARWQGKIDWATTADAEITRKLPSGDKETIGKLRFVYCKATHGTSGIDKEFAHNSVGRKAMRWSGYYFWFVPGQPPKKQAEWCFQNIEKTYTSRDLCVAMDFEELAPVGYGPSRLLQEGQECGERMEELLGHKIITYSGKGYWDHPQGCAGLDSEWFASHDYWHAEYRGHVPLETEMPRLSAPWAKRGIRARAWQWDGDKGIYLPNGTDSDFNFFDGSEDDLQHWIDTTGIPPTPEPGLQLSDQSPPHDPYRVDRLEAAIENEGNSENDDQGRDIS